MINKLILCIIIIGLIISLCYTYYSKPKSNLQLYIMNEESMKKAVDTIIKEVGL